MDKKGSSYLVIVPVIVDMLMGTSLVCYLTSGNIIATSLVEIIVGVSLVRGSLYTTMLLVSIQMGN